MDLELIFDNRTLEFTSLSGNNFIFYADQTQLPQINRKTINLAPSKVFDSPFVQSDWASGKVVIQNGEKKAVLDFNKSYPQ